MRNSSQPESQDELRALVFAPSGRDAQLIAQMLLKTGISTTTCQSPEDLARELPGGVGVVILTEEALSQQLMLILTRTIREQPPWSDLPVLLLTSPGQVSRVSERRREYRDPLGNVLLLERPVRPETMLSSVQGALRGRKRQYEIRDHIAQYRRAEEALRKSEKLAVAGRLAASIAHEINNPLEAIMNVHYLMAHSRSIEEIKGYLTLAQEELARVNQITKQTLKFHRETKRSVAVNMAEIVESALALYAARLRSAGITVVKRFGEVPLVEGFEGELRQVLANLIGNALDAMRGGGRLIINLRCTRRENGGAIRVTIADTGTGIAPAVRGNLFEPFVSTKGNTGTGLGLWVSAEIIQRHGGSIRVKTRENLGTVFSIVIPRANVGSEIMTA